ANGSRPRPSSPSSSAKGSSANDETGLAHRIPDSSGPRDVPHRYTVKRGPARMLFFFTPGGFEELLRATSVPTADRRIPPDGEGMPDMETFPDVVRRYGCELLS
ncbi:hypothetical protein NKH05_25620, partial [Mesorhizobium sp. M1399]